MSARKDSRPPVSRRARVIQVIVGLVIGLIVGVLLSWLTAFWWWLPAGVVFGVAVGMIMRPPADNYERRDR